MTYQGAMAATSRELDIRGTITLPDTTVINLTNSHIMAYTIDEGGARIPLGSAASSSYTLELSNAQGEWFPGGSIVSYKSILGALVSIEIGVKHDGAYEYEPAGVWYVHKPSGKEGGTRFVLRGNDALFTAYDGWYDDSAINYSSSTTVTTILEHIKGLGVTIGGTLACNATAVIASRPDWGANCTIRQALSFIAGVGGCFVAIDRTGALQLVKVNSGAAAKPISTVSYMELENDNTFFAFNRVKIMPRGATAGAAYIEAALQPAPEAGNNTIVITDNPLFAVGATNLQTMATELATALSGYNLDLMTFTHRGDPTMILGDRVSITDRRGETITTPIIQQTMQFGAGFRSTISCRISLGATLPSTISPNGTISSVAFGKGTLDPFVLMLKSITSQHIAADAITTTELATGAITADKAIIADGAIGNAQIKDLTLEKGKFAAATITALNTDALNAVKAYVQSMVAGNITADQMWVDIATIARAQLTTANIENADITWADINTLAAEIATVAKAQITTANIVSANIDWASIVALESAIATIANAEIGTADIDWAHVKDLVAGTAILTQGVGGEFYFSKLAVTDANMLSLTVGEMVVKGSDGLFYSIIPDGSGGVTTVQKFVGNDDIEDLSIDADEKVIDGSITARTLNAEEIFAETATIQTLIGANIDVDELFARDATVTQINAVDIRGNGYLQMALSDYATITLVEGAISTAVGSVQTDVDDIAVRLSTAEQILTSDSITSLVRTSTEYKTDMQNVADEISTVQSELGNKADTSALANYATTDFVNEIKSTEITQRNDAIEFAISKETKRAEGVEKEIKEFTNTAKTYFMFLPEGLEIGKDGSPFKTLLGDQKLSFKQGGVEVAFIQYNRLYISVAEIMDMLTLGKATTGYTDIKTTKYGNEGGISGVWRAN